jgi:hypothetical protein
VIIWDEKVLPRAAELGHLGHDELANLALDCVELAMAMFSPPFGEYLPPSHVALVLSVLENRVLNPDDWQRRSACNGDFLARYDHLPPAPVKPSVGPFMMALVRLHEALDAGLDAEETMEIISSCREAVVVSELRGRASREDEASCVRCNRSIAGQSALIDAYVGR